MGKLLELALYNPARLSDDDFLAGFVARRNTAERIAGRLRQIKLAGLAQHRLIVGQRGMGKTSLLRWIALEVRHDSQLATVLIPLSFREEQYNVHSLHKLWCNCLDALGDYFESCGESEKAADLDSEVAKLDRAQDKDGSQALDLFRSWMKKEKRRPLLLIDNIDIVLGGLSKDGWNLRRVLQEAGGIVVIGGSTSALEVAINPQAPFYEFFQVDLLEPLGLDEVKDCLRQLASLRGDSGRVVQNLLMTDPARIQVLHELTGGNPRTLAMLYLILEESGTEDVMADLERLLDQATPLYKARVEELAPQARVVFDAVALNWDPVAAGDIASATTLTSATVSTQLDRLEQDGVIGKTTLSTTRRFGYQVAERFFNIWYLMRHGPRRQRQRLKWLTEALRQLYAPSELGVRGQAILDKFTVEGSASLASYCLAFGEALEEGPLRYSLLECAYRFDAELRYDAIDRTNIALFARGPGEPNVRLYERLSAIPLSVRAWVELGDSLISDRPEEAIVAYKSAIDLAKAMPEFSDFGPNFDFNWFRLGLILWMRGHHFDSLAALRFAVGSENLPDPIKAVGWDALGNILADQFSQFSEAERAYRQALALFPEYEPSRRNLSYLLIGQGRLPEAQAHYHFAVQNLNATGVSLLQAFRYLAESNLEYALDELGNVMQGNPPELLTKFRDDLLRFFRLAASKGWGDRVLVWLDSSGLSDIFRPLRVSYDAYLHGEKRLQDVNPEVRGGAAKLLAELGTFRHGKKERAKKGA